MAVDECRYRSERALNATREFYSVQGFRSNFRRGVKEIVSSTSRALVGHKT